MNIENFIFWIAMPTVRLTDNSDKKYVRVLGFLAMFPLFPLAIIGMLMLFFLIIVDIIREI